MNTKIRSKKKAILVALLLSFLYAIICESLFYILYNYEAAWGKWDLIIYASVFLYTLPVCLLYRNKYWPAYLLVLLISPLLSIISLYLFGGMTEVKEDDMAVGFLMIMVWGMQGISLVVGTCIGLIINWIVTKYLASKS